MGRILHQEQKSAGDHVGSRGVDCLRGRFGTQGRGGGHRGPCAALLATRQGSIIARRPVEVKVRRAGGSRQRGGAPVGRGGHANRPAYPAFGSSACEFSATSAATTSSSATAAASAPSSYYPQAASGTQPTVGGTLPLRSTSIDDADPQYASAGEQQLGRSCHGPAATTATVPAVDTETEADKSHK